MLYHRLMLLGMGLLSGFGVFAQTEFGRPGDFSVEVIRRMEIKSGQTNPQYFTDIQPFDRGRTADFIRHYDSLGLWQSPVDRFNRHFLIRENLPYTKDLGEDSLIESQKPILTYFYQDPANFFSVDEEDVHFQVNPILNLQGGREFGLDRTTYINTRGVEVRGSINDKVGFYSLVTENQIVAADYVQQRRRDYGFFPQEGFGKGIEGGGYDFFDVRGYITFSATKNIQMSFGKDRNFLGNGERSLLLGNFHEDYLQLRIQTKVWKFQYQNIFAEMIWSDRVNRQNYTNLPYAKKYVSLHYLSINLLKNLKVGLFEGVIYHDNNNAGRSVELGYLNPIIFYRAIEHNLGDNDNMIIGGNIYYLPVKKLALHGQFIFSEFKISELRAGDGWFGNQWGLQAGARYIDAFGLRNVDLLAEVNLMRPYVYGHTNPGNAYNHFNQALAHPYGANFRELIGKVNAQLWPKLNLEAALIYYETGLDSDSRTNWGADIRKDPSSPEERYGNTIAQGEFTRIGLAYARASYQIRHQMFLEATAQHRIAGSSLEAYRYDHLWLQLGLRWNIGRREYWF